MHWTSSRSSGRSQELAEYPDCRTYGVGIQSFAAVGFVLFIVGVLFTIFYSYLVSAYLYGALALEEQEKGMVAV